MKAEIARHKAAQARSTMHHGQNVEDMDLDTLLNDGHPKAKEYKYDLMWNPIRQPNKEFHKKADPIKNYSESMYKLLTFAPEPRKDFKPPK